MGSKFSALLKYSSLLLLSTLFFQSHAATYYSQKSLGGSNNATLLSAWNSSIVGGGSNPSNFTSGDEFHIVNGDNMIATALWTVSGGGKLVIESGKFSANGFDHNLTADIQNTGEYAVKSAYKDLNLGSVSSTSTFTVEYAQGGVSNHFRYLTYGGNLNLKVSTNVGLIIHFTSSFTTGGNLILNTATLSQFFSFEYQGPINIGGSLIQNNGAFYPSSSSSSLSKNTTFNIGGDAILNNGVWYSAKFAGSPTFNIAGDFKMSNGTFYGIINSSTGNSVFNISGNIAVTGGTYIAKNSTSAGLLTYNLTGSGKTITLNPIVLTSDNHVIKVNGTYSLLSNLSLTNLLSINTGASLSIGSNTLSINASFLGTGSLIGGVNSNISVSSVKILTQSISLKSITLNTFTINNNLATVTLAGALNITNALNLVQGTINNSSQAINIYNNATIVRNVAKVTAAPVFEGVVNLIYNGASTLTDLEVPYNNSTKINNVTFSNSGSIVKLSNNITINGTLTINPSATFDTNGKTLTLKGNVSNNGLFSNGNNTVVFAGNSVLSGSSDFAFNNLTLNTGGSLTSPAGGMITIGNIFTANSGSSFIPNLGTVAFARTSGTQVVPGKVQFYNVQLSNAATKSFSITDTVYIANNFNISGGSINTSKSTINFNGSTQSIPTLAYNNLILAGSGTKTPVSSPLTVSNNLAVLGGAILNGSNATINLTGQWTSANANSYSGLNGLVNFKGTTPSNINANGASFNDVSFNTTSTETFTSAATITGILTLTKGTINTGGFLVVNLTTGAVSGAGTGTLNGNVTFVKNIPTAASNFLAFPVAGATANDLADDFEFVSPSTNKSRLSIWDCTTQKYLTGQPINTAFTQGIGFQFYATVSGDVDVTGAYAHAASYTTTACSAAANKFVLAGNPYPSTLDWNSAGWTKTNLNDALYFFNPASGTFATYVNGIPSNGGSQYIPSFQGFYITTNGGGIGSLTATNTVRTTAINPNLYSRTAASSAFALEVSYKNYTDEAVIVLNDNASFDFEGDKDALKMINPDAAPSLYTTSLGVDYSINSLPSLGASYVMPLGLKVTETGAYTFTPKNVDAIEGNVYLEDKTTGVLVDLKSSPTHTVTVDSTQTNRFQLRFANSGTSTVSAATTNIYYFNGTINVTLVNSNTTGNLSLYNVLGTAVMSNIAVTGSGQISTTSIAPGAYIVKVVENGTITSKKIIVQ